MTTRLEQSGGFRAVGTALVAATAVMGCASQSDIERRNDTAVAHVNRDAARSPMAGLPRAAPITVADRARWYPILQWPASCEDAFRSSHAGEDGGLAFHTMGHGLSTVEVLCAAGSYQPSHVFLRVDERRSSPMSTLLQFPTYQSEDGLEVTQQDETEIFGETAVSPDGREISVLSLGRQLADCGIWTRYAIDSERPKVMAAATRLPCPDAPGEPVRLEDQRAPDGWRTLNP